MLKQTDAIFNNVANRLQSSSFVFDILFALLCLKPVGISSTQKHHSELSPAMKLLWTEVLF